MYDIRHRIGVAGSPAAVYQQVATTDGAQDVVDLRRPRRLGGGGEGLVPLQRRRPQQRRRGPGDGHGGRRAPRRRARRLALPLDAVDLPAHLQQLVRPGGRTGPPGRRPDREFASGRRATPDGRPWRDLAAAERADAVDAHRLAYLSEQIVNWCPGLGTVLADEEVTGEGRSAVGNYPVYRRPLRQWMLRITAYAERTAGRPGPGGLAGARQAPAAELDRPERRPLPPERLAVLPAALLG